LSGQKKECWLNFFRNYTSEFERLRELSTNSETEKQNLDSLLQEAKNNLEALEEKNTWLTGNAAKYYCEHQGISNLYHITPIENILSIMKNGLFCYNIIMSKNYPHSSCSNSDIQENNRAHKIVGGKSANDYVPLFFSEKPPMLKAIEDKHEFAGKVIVYICIGCELIGQEGIYFSDGNIACNGTQVYHKLEDLAKLDWRNIREFHSETLGLAEAKRIKSAEVLVISRIDPSWFEKFIVPDQEAMDSLKELLPQAVPIEIKPEFYYTYRGQKRF
jgi:hypothetical protein